MPHSSCYCGSPASYEQCCAPLIEGQMQATTPEQLMRSRFSAYALCDDDYLLATHSSDSKLKPNRKELLKTFSDSKWFSLQVLASSASKNAEGEEAFVEFVAWYQNSKAPRLQIHENSRFVYNNGRWFYLDGEFLPDYKPGRNDICWCGSGKKLKKCHAN